MADTCQNISKALNNLNRKIDAQNKCCNEARQELKRLNNKINSLDNRVDKLGNRVDKLERDIENLKRTRQKHQDLTGILRRISALESYCLSVEELFTDVEQASSRIMKQVLGFMDFFSFIFK